MRDFVASKDKLVAGGFYTRECAQFAELYAALQRQSGEVVPPRKAFSPSQAPRTLLPYVSLIELREPKLALVRLVGTAIVNRVGFDSTGSNMLDTLPEPARDWSWNNLQHVVGTPCGLTFVFKEDYERVSLWVEVVSFPLALDDKPALVVSLSVEVNRQQLPLRGERAMQMGDVSCYRHIDIGKGI